MKSSDNSRAKKSKKRKKTKRGPLAKVFGALICRKRRSSSLSSSSQSSENTVDDRQTLSTNKDSSLAASPTIGRNDDIRLINRRLEKSTQTLDPSEVATIARYYDQNLYNVDAGNVRASVDVDYDISELNRQRKSTIRAGPSSRNECSSGRQICGSNEDGGDGGNVDLTPTSSSSSSLSSTSTTPVQDRDVISFFDGDPRERDYIVQCSRNKRDPNDFRRLIDVKTKEKDTYWNGSNAGVGTGAGIGGGRPERVINTVGPGHECCGTKAADGNEPPTWYCERMARKTSASRRPSCNSTGSSSTDDDSVHSSYETVVEPIVHQLSRGQPKLRLLPNNLTAEEKKRMVKIVAVILATAGVAALIMLLLRYKRAGSRRRRGVVCSDLCNDDGDLVSTSSSTVSKAAGATVGSCDDDNDNFDDEGTCVYEKFDRVKCSNSNFKGLVCKSEKLRESDNTVCASHDFRKVTKRLKEPKTCKPNSFTRLEKDRICDAKKCFETL